VKITIILLVSVFLRTSAASAAGPGADCATAYQNSDVLGELVVVETAFRDGADTQATEASMRLLSGLGCLDEVLPKAIAGRVYRAVGAGLYVSGEMKRGMDWMRTALEVDEDFSFRVDDFVAGHAVFGAYKKLGREMLPDTSLADGKLSAGKHYLDGRPLYSKMATEDRPHLYQHKYNGVQTTVIEGNLFPEMVTEDNRVVLSNVGSSPEKDNRAVKKAAKKAAKAAAKLAKAEAKAAAKLAKTEAAETVRLEAEAQRVAKLEATQAAKAQAEEERLAAVEAKTLRDSEEKAVKLEEDRLAAAKATLVLADTVTEKKADEYAAAEAEKSRLAARQAELDDAEATADVRAQERERIAKAEVARVEAANAAQRDATELAQQKSRDQKVAKTLAAQQAKAAANAQAEAEAEASAQAKAQAKADAKRAKVDAKRLAKVKPKKATSTTQHSNRLGAVVLQRERPVLKTPMLIAGVLVGVGVSGSLYYGAFDARSAFNQATTEQQVFDSRSKTNQLLVASGAALAVGSGMYTVGVILSDSGFSLRGNF
jgi:hypothetical protein